MVSYNICLSLTYFNQGQSLGPSTLMQIELFHSFYFILNFLFCTVIQLINYVVIVSGGQQRDSAIHIHVSILPQISSHPGFQVTLSRVPCAIQLVLIGYPSYIYQCHIILINHHPQEFCIMKSKHHKHKNGSIVCI